VRIIRNPSAGPTRHTQARLSTVTPANIALVLASALAHAYWNFLFKKNAGAEVFIALSKVVETLVFAPAFVLLALPGMPATPFVLWLVVVATLGVLTNYAALTMAYRHGDLSVVYPVSRGATLLFLPPLGLAVFGERVNALGIAGLVSILAGILSLNLRELSWRGVREIRALLGSHALRWSLAVALNNAVFTLWDKYAVHAVEPFAYMYGYTSLTAVCYAAFVWRRHPRSTIATEWQSKWRAIIQVGVLNVLSYLLVLFALRSGVSSYTIGFRQLSIAIGVILAWRFLHETLTRPRRLGALLIVGGCLLVAIAR
jgi:drug/metabolite transporter (DMT)-like permease